MSPLSLRLNLHCQKALNFFSLIRNVRQDAIGTRFFPINTPSHSFLLECNPFKPPLPKSTQFFFSNTQCQARRNRNTIFSQLIPLHIHCSVTPLNLHCQKAPNFFSLIRNVRQDAIGTRFFSRLIPLHIHFYCSVTAFTPIKPPLPINTPSHSFLLPLSLRLNLHCQKAPNFFSLIRNVRQDAIGTRFFPD